LAVAGAHSRRPAFQGPLILATTYDDWMGRAYAHREAGRPVDAMLCYQRAAALQPDAADPRYLLGEVQWQLGAIPAAVASWRDAVRVAPRHLAPRLALAEAQIALGDLTAAGESAERAQALAPDDATACVLRSVADFASGRDAATLVALRARLADGPGRLESPAVGGALAQGLRSSAGAAGAVELLAALVPHVETVAFALLAPMAHAACAVDAPTALADARAAIHRAALERPLGAADVDSLREVARAFARTGDRAVAAPLVRRYAEASVALAPPLAPAGWPARTTGESLRVVALLPPDDDAAVRAMRLLADVVARRPATAWTLVVAGDARALPLGALPGAIVRAWPPNADAGFADAIAASDPDLLLDLAGIALSSGAVLARHPAPMVASAGIDAPAHEQPLIDEQVTPDAESLAGLLERAAAHAGARDRCALGLAELGRAYERAVSSHRDGRSDDAKAEYDAVLAVQPAHAPTLHLAAALAREGGDVDRADALLRRALRVAPGFVEARAAAARLARDSGRIEEGLALIDAGIEAAPRSVVLWRVRGELELAHGDGAAAREAFGQALALAPTDAEAHYNLGVALQKLGEPAEAARAYQRALAFDPGFADAHFNLGVLFQETGHVDPACSAYRAVLERQPHHAAAYRNLGETLLGAGRIEPWLANFRRFEAACPDALPLAVQALEACQYAADHAGIERYLDGLRAERFKARDAVELCEGLEQLLYLLLFFDVEPELILRLATTYNATAPKVYGPPRQRPAERRPGRLRIGYLSADLRNHVMGKMMWQAVRHHDRERFAVHFYSLSPVRDEWTERFVSAGDRFEVIAGMPERAAAARIAADDLDLLVDLSGHTKGGKPGILAAKPARVQITHVASAGSVGLDTVDFKLTDAFADIPGNQDWMIEALLPMQGCVYPYRHVAPAATNPFTRQALGIASDAVVLGAFVTPMKLSRRCLALWRDVLARVPRAVLAFSPTQSTLRPVFERLCSAAGIPRERLVFVPQGRDDAENQCRYALVDFVLDPMPFGGVNGVIEPLDAGVPVLAQVGARHGERSAWSILANLGVTHTVAQSGRDYVELAARLAEDRPFMREVREAIRGGLAKSRLTDGVAHTRALEAAYLDALARAAPDALAEAERG
jgi:predicted O-linked N-acetylglucosamine transferase (SPINDLY family)